MQAFYRQKDTIKAAFPKPTVTEITPEPVLGTITNARKRFQKLLRGVLV
jgi:hypothetical protein